MTNNVCGVRLSTKKAVVEIATNRALSANESVPISVCTSDLESGLATFVLKTETLNDQSARLVTVLVQESTAGIALAYSDSGFARILVRREAPDTAATDLVITAMIILDTGSGATPQFRSPAHIVPPGGDVGWIVGK